MKKSISLFFVLLIGFAARSQNLTKDTTQNVGLVFSGGGAKCIAQIGVLKVIEESGLQIDYISGTSMGAIIGSLYALGYSAQQIEDEFRRIDWDALLTNEIPRNRLGYYDRKSDSKYLLTFPVSNKKIALPGALNYAQYILKELNYLTQQSYQFKNFREFPIPFLCVATNLENGELKVFEKGNLAHALRASSAFPSLFTPFYVNDTLYSDGGLVNNYPVLELKKKGVKHVIGIDVQDLLYSKEELGSMMAILEQTASFVNAKDYEEQLAATDVHIKPNLEGASITSFDQFDKLLIAGEEAARLQLAKLEQLAESQPASKNQKQEAIPLSNFWLSDITIEGNQTTQPSYILGKLNVKIDREVNIEKINKGIDQLYGSGYYKHISYNLTPNNKGYILHLKVDEKQSLAEFKIGLHYDDDFKTALLLNFSKRNVLIKNTKLNLDMAIGQSPRGELNFYIDKGLIPSPGIRLKANRFKTRLYEKAAPTTQLNFFDYSAEIYLQSTFKDQIAIAGGVKLEGVELSQDLAITPFDDSFRKYINYFALLDFDNLDNANYPKRGSQVYFKTELISRYQNFQNFYPPTTTFQFKLKQVIPLYQKLTLVPSIRTFNSIGETPDYPFNSLAGSLGQNYINAIQPFLGYRYMELIGNNTLVVRIDANFEIVKNHYILVKGNWGKLEDSFQNIIESSVILDGYALGYGFNSALGPIELHVIKSTNHSEIYSYINLGFWF